MVNSDCLPTNERSITNQSVLATVLAAKSTTWFQLFWIPLVPISKKHVWICGTCQWRETLTNKWVEAQLYEANKSINLLSSNAPQALASLPTAGAWVTPVQPGYHPVYIQWISPASKTALTIYNPLIYIWKMSKNRRIAYRFLLTITGKKSERSQIKYRSAVDLYIFTDYRIVDYIS